MQYPTGKRTGISSPKNHTQNTQKGDDAMASIQERRNGDGSTSYRAVIRLKGHPTAFGVFKRKTDAVRWAKKAENEILEGRYFQTTEAKKHTMEEAVDRYIRDILPRKPRSAKQQEAQLNWWKKGIGKYTMADVTPPLIVEHRDALMKETKATTTANANRYMAILSHLFTIAMKEWGWVDDTPFRKVQRLQEPRGRVRFLDDTERKNLLNACKDNPNPNLFDVVLLAISTGCRKNEILGLRWRDVDLERGQITLLDTKNKTPRAAPLTGPALERMKERSRIRRIDTDCCFPYTTLAKPADIDRDFARARKAAGIENLHFHDLRHTAASYLAMSGATLAEIAAVLGHKTLAMVQRYAHLTDAHTSRIVATMTEKYLQESKTACETDTAS
jgi:integrase